MRTQVLIVTLAVVAVLAALPLAQSKAAAEHGGLSKGASASAWPCCDSCGSCTRSIPPQCQCMDAAPAGCHPACKSCVVKSSGGGSEGAPVFQCNDMIVNFCKRRCTRPAADDA
ncbi:hypothetical protein BAE44_0007415 [Dichanthelium oligosanthes]|uniref:Bowman-Birk serine protease inhibitors family domain-containing protein n=1 Tax=Dichanthelium oligosanthes TaxID=888268 RepID=A0A1E5W2C3_9POAL|nr:hypothetical protein BAE44_0007415 [Dichanthelium oligosanthes]